MTALLAPLLAACAAAQGFWVDTPSSQAPLLPAELSAMRQAIAARVDRLPDHCPSTEAARLEALVATGRTREGGPICAARPPLAELIALRGIPHVVGPQMSEDQLSFASGDTVFALKLPADAPQTWPARIAAAEPGGALEGGGGRSAGMVGRPLGVAIDVYTGFEFEGGSYASREALATALAPCRQTGPARDPHHMLTYELVVALDAQGGVTHVGHRTPEGQGPGGACIRERLSAQTLPELAGKRLIVHVSDRAPEPLKGSPYDLIWTLHDAPKLIDTAPLVAEPRFVACSLPRVDLAFELDVDAAGAVTDARVDDLGPAPGACFVEATRHLRFTCPEGGAVTLKGTVRRKR